MFALKFYNHNDDAHEVFSCERYNISNERCHPETAEELERPTSAPMRFVVRMFRTWNDGDPYYEYIGDREAYSHCFVVNESGKTIDTIR